MALLTVPVGEASPGETAPRRNVKFKDAPLERPVGMKCKTVSEYMEECAERQPKVNAMGYRKFVNTYTELKKTPKGVEKEWTYYEYSPYSFITYQNVIKLTRDYGKGLVKLGLEPEQVSKLQIFASTSYRWMLTFLATQTQNIPIVTAYDTLGEEGLTHSLVETELSAVFTDNVLLDQLIKPLQKAKSVKYIIHGDKIDPEDKRLDGKFYENAKKAMDKILEVRPEIKFISFEECIELGKEASDIEVKSAKPEDLSCIMYTSGSTGTPKGVVLTQGNIVAAIAGTTSVADRGICLVGERLIAFLPLAHIFELVLELTAFYWGACLGYATVKTLTADSCRNCQPDLIEFKPNLMVGVAAVWESLRKGVFAKVKQQPYLTQKLFWTAYKLKSSFKAYNIPGGGLFDIIFKKIKSATGGHLKYVLNGGSPISIDAQEFVSTLIAPMLVGYGLTETAANGTIVDYHHPTYGIAGTLVGSQTAKLVDVTDAGYFAKNNQGELWLKGKANATEYFHNEKETSEAFTEDGWFKTGDIGEWTSNGALKIIDRKKNLVKTMNGEYIALEKLESVYRSNTNILNVCVYADQSQVKPIAIIIPNEHHLHNYLSDQKIYSKEELSSKDLEDLCEDKKVTNAVLKSLLQTGREQGLKGIELLQNIVLLDTEWTPQNGFVTSAQKLQRKKILESCKDKVAAAYKA